MQEHDHRSLAVRLDLYHIEEAAPGMVFWHPRGFAIYRVLEDYIRARMRSLSYAEVRTPQLLPIEMWERSGHWEKFSENMFRVDGGEGRDMALKPMSCPCHLQIFNDQKRSWRDLPMRYAEFGLCHRNESSGSMHGLMRTRAFEQDDAHVLCAPDQVRGEVARFASLLADVYRDMGFSDIEVSLSTRPDVRAGEDSLWDWSEGELLAAARACGLDPVIKPGEGAFYGPKIEFALRDRMGRHWQSGTIQLDSVLPARLGAAYVGQDGSDHVPVMIHHAVFGSMGRFMALLLEQHGGSLPFWLSPDQIAVLPVNDDPEVRSHASFVVMELMRAGLRPTMIEARETLSRRIVEAHEREIPVMAIVGAREAASGTVTLRGRDGINANYAVDAAVKEMTAMNRP